MRTDLTERGTLIIVDVQIDFCPGGALAVDRGDEVVGLINGLSARFAHVVATQDWHPAGHLSFASSHADAAPFSVIELGYGSQTLWPDHCIAGTPGADFHPGLDLTPVDLVIRKGFRPTIDSYSAFFENDRSTPTGLAGYLRERGLTELAFAGLATDFCVAWSAMDAVRCGFSASILMPACRAIDLSGSLEAAVAALKGAGVTVMEELP
ncbi:bifunctional nicotinamidase/pyrazinamidase [Methylobrevis pamukkalensis]|uniref:Nicotinamidase n=1 Tax=Methylobrevis pamukkalensis TaxID=1439726 RepID=A0A1E3H8D3_9HYPH|nr:bifunctional nicotinamidase/pyrazinamidase [Methylobrevis pamukkalensis]ODN72573.1 nicotinamidase/pyrazinamidase [Methylobrevis pamukkalensis]